MKRNKLLIVALVSICLFILICSLSTSYAVILEDGIRVEENSDLTYYLDISYDGKDKNIIMSSDTAIAEVKSDYIYIEDRIPDGLIFKGFVNTSNGSIGAVERGDSSRSCLGSVVGGYDGLKYDDNTRIVSFKIKNLQAGCKITVGILTTTPELGAATRMDFYNTAFAKEGDFGIKSNTVHVFMGRENATLYDVTYKYTGDVPKNAPNLPGITSYVSGASVGVLNDISIDGYSFSGWSSSDVSISGNSFVMPDKDVVLEGSFTKKNTYTVSYSVTGDSPGGYLAPNDKSYGAGDDVVVDSLKVGDEINGYRFLGWTADDIDLSNGIFTMPKDNVELVGSFEKISYKVIYKFQGAIIPDNYASLLPIEKSYYPGDIVKIEASPQTIGYRFLGWYKGSSFKMPEDDVVIYGEWMIDNGVFSPKITRIIENEQESYQEKQVVSSIIRIQNTASYPIIDVRVKENTGGSYFVSADGYELLTDSMVNIPIIGAGEIVTLKTEYVVTGEYQKRVVNEAEIIGALASNNYYFDTSKVYKAQVDFMIVNPALKVNRIDKDGNVLTGYEFGIYKDKDTKNLISKGMHFDILQAGNTYYLKELTAPNGYAQLDEILKVEVSEEGSISIEGYEVRIENNIAVVDIITSKILFANLPNTLDSIIIYLGLFAISIVCIIGIIIYTRKTKRKKKYNDEDINIEIL